jgi:uncharacterized protein YegP (UPF0339 family)
MWRRVGDGTEYKANIEFIGAPGTWSGPKVTLKSGHVIDTAKLPDNGQFGTSLGSLAIYDAGTRVFSGSTIYTSTTEVIGYSADPVSADGTLSNTSPMTFASGDVIAYSFTVPIVGWSSSVQTSDSADTRVVSFSANTSTTSATTSTPFVYTVKDHDTHGAYSTITGKFTAPVQGKYHFSFNNYTGATAAQAKLYKNGTAVYTGSSSVASTSVGSGSYVLNLVAGDTVEVRPETTATASTGATFNTFSGFRLSGPSAIAASESVNMLANTAATSISTATETVVNGTVMFDSHGAYNSTTGVYTAPISGKYRITTGIRFPSTAIGVGGVQELYVQKNSEANIPIARSNWSSVTVTIMLNGSYTFNLLAGETLKVKAYNNTTSSLTGGDSNFVEIQRIGN